MKILVTFALDEEFAPWREMRKFERRKSGASDAYWAQIGEGEVSVMLTGVGAKQPSFEFPRDIWVGADTLGFCVSSGLAGALRPEYRLGQVLAARSVSEFSHVGGAAGQALECSSSLLSFASECGATVANRFYTSGRVIARAEEKRQLGHTSDAVEMESAGIMRAAMEEGIPAVAIRAISDLAEEDLPLDMAGVFNDEGRVSVPRVIGQVALHPASIPGLVKLGKQSKLAAESLVRFLDQYVGMVAGRMKVLESKVEVATR
jgi:nucleoside phosphorylase